MKDLRLTVKINKSIKDVFEFTTNPKNTPFWITSLVKEEADTDHVTQGTVLSNVDKQGHVNTYTVSRYEPPHVFQIDAIHQDYKLR